jgi:uncharacterized integral membrane protein (TIGR00697 family)
MNYKIDKKINIYMILLSLYCVALVVSNIISNRTFEIGQFMLPSAVIIFPIIYIINDVLTECYGFKMASKAIWTAFGLNLMAVMFFNIAVNLPTESDYSSYNVVLGNTLKPLVASVLAYLIGSFVNAKVMDSLRNHKSLMLRCVLSTLFGETIDAAIFISIMFIGVMDFKIVCTMIATQAIAKTLYEVIVYPITKKVIITIKSIGAEA